MSVDIGNSVSFSEEVPDNILEGETETERGRRSVITICNGADAIIYLELHPIEMVRRNIARNKDFGLGVETAGGVNVKVANVITIHPTSRNALLVRPLVLRKVQHVLDAA